MVVDTLFWILDPSRKIKKFSRVSHKFYFWFNRCMSNSMYTGRAQFGASLSRLSSCVLLWWLNVNNDKHTNLFLKMQAPTAWQPESIGLKMRLGCIYFGKNTFGARRKKSWGLEFGENKEFILVNERNTCFYVYCLGRTFWGKLSLGWQNLNRNEEKWEANYAH